MPRLAPVSRPLAAIVIAASALMTTPSHAASPFETLAGSWSGRGKVEFNDGQSEQLRCSAYYKSMANGNQLRLSIRCASAAAKVDLRATLAYAGGSVSGSWEERTFNVAGNVSGSATSSGIRLAYSGGGTGGSMNVSMSRSSHQVSITSTGSGLKAVTMSLGRGN